MNYPKLREDMTPFLFDSHKIDDPYQWIRNPKNEELLKWVQDENQLTSSFFQKYSDVYNKHLQRNTNKKVYESYHSISSYENGYTASTQNNGIYKISRFDNQFNELEGFDDILSTIPNTIFFSAAICPNDSNYAVFQGLIDGYDRPTLFLFDLENQKLIHQADGVFSYTFAKIGKVLVYGDATADVENEITYNHLKQFDIDTGIETLLYSYPNNAIDIAPYTENDGDIIISVMHDYSNNVILFQNTNGFTKYNEEPAIIKYCGKLNNTYILCDYSQKEYGEVIAYNPETNEKISLFTKENVFITNVVVVNQKTFILATKDVDSVAYVIENHQINQLSLPQHCCATFEGVDEKNESIFVVIESFNLIPQLFRLNNLGYSPVKSDYIPADDTVEIEQIFYLSKDGTQIPAYLVYKKGTEKNHQIQTLMYGYGGYNVPSQPWYNNPFCGLNVIDWVNDGGLYVHCNIRGGSEYGEKWHTDGYMQKKKNCYYDFIAIAEGIIQDGWTSPQYIAINGGSNGGLLMTALVTMRPDLWGCVIASVPHTDMISFVNDDRGPMYITEYGNPHNEEQFQYFLTYSPFHNIKHTNYPPIYIQTGECDNNVPPYHGKKMAARLQQWNTSNNPILLRVLATGSHDRGKGDEFIKTVTEMQTFIELSLKGEFNHE